MRSGTGRPSSPPPRMLARWKEKSLYGRILLGIERATSIIDERGIISHVFRKVKVDGHTEEVLAALAWPLLAIGAGA